MRPPLGRVTTIFFSFIITLYRPALRGCPRPSGRHTGQCISLSGSASCLSIEFAAQMVVVAFFSAVFVG